MRFVLEANSSVVTGEKSVSISLVGTPGSVAGYTGDIESEARFAIFGASIRMGGQSDNIRSKNGSVELWDSSSLDMGGGDNKVNLVGMLRSQGGIFLTGDGHDSIKTYAEVNGINLQVSSFSTGGGDDSIEASSRPSKNGNYAASSDTAGFFLWNSRLSTGDGNDVLTGLGMSGIVEGVPLSDSSLNKGVGFLMREGSVIDTGLGNDLITGGAIYFGATSYACSIYTGAGDDVIESPIFGSVGYRHIIDMGEGVDRVRLRALDHYVTAIPGGYLVDFGGSDAIAFYGVEYVSGPTSNWIPLEVGYLRLREVTNEKPDVITVEHPI